MYEELVKRLRAQADYYCCHMGINSPPAMTFVEAADAIEELSKTLDEEVEINTALECNMPVWIPITERLPINQNNVLCDDEGGVVVGYYTDEEVGWHDMHSYKIYPTHWMPLPKPPKEESNGV